MRMFLRYGIVAVTSCLFIGLAGCGNKTGDKPAGDSTAAAAATTGGDAVAETNIAKSREFIERVFNKGDMAAIDELVAADFVEHNPMPGQEPGIAGFKKMVTEWRTAFPDQVTTIDDIFASGDKVVIRSTVAGTNSGPMMGSPATNKKVKVEGIGIIRIKDGKAVEHWGQVDAVGMLTQLGMMPSSPEGGAPAGGDAAKAPADGSADGAKEGASGAEPAKK